MRKYYIDNLRWMVILLLIPYHAAQAFNTWGENFYVYFEPNKAISSLICFFAPFIMPLLFLFAGMSTRFALGKRSVGQYIVERIKRLIVPLIFGTLAFVPVMSYIGNKYNCGYEGNYFTSFAVFFTKFTDLSGFDGGFNIGQFWFLLYLFVISMVSLGIILLQKKLLPKMNGNLPLWAVILLGLPLPLFSNLLSVGGKSYVEFLYIFLVGYYVFANDSVTEKIAKYRFVFLPIGLLACTAYVICFIWLNVPTEWVNDIFIYVGRWFMILGLIGIGKKHMEFHGKGFSYLSRISFAFFSIHFVIVVVMQYVFTKSLRNNIILLYLVPVVLSYILTFAFSEVFMKVPPLRFLIGAKTEKKEKTG